MYVCFVLFFCQSWDNRYGRPVYPTHFAYKTTHLTSSLRIYACISSTMQIASLWLRIWLDVIISLSGPYFWRDTVPIHTFKCRLTKSSSCVHVIAARERCDNRRYLISITTHHSFRKGTHRFERNSLVSHCEKRGKDGGAGGFFFCSVEYN